VGSWIDDASLCDFVLIWQRWQHFEEFVFLCYLIDSEISVYLSLFDLAEFFFWGLLLGLTFGG
jgi:hypothetical protein